MRATPTGSSVKVFNSSGVPVGTMESSLNGYGGLSLSNPAGVNSVEAGTLEGGLGVVRTGPRFGGPVGNLTVPYQIVGRK